jgi:hypothetical protein
MKHHRLLIACILPFLLPNVVFADKTTQEHLTEGNAFLTSGKLHDAVISYDAAICKLKKKKGIDSGLKNLLWRSFYCM